MSNYHKGLDDRIGKIPSVKKGRLKNGSRGNLQTVSEMIKIARHYSGDPLIVRTAHSIINQAGTESHNHLDEARAIGEWVKANLPYAKDPDGIEQLQSPNLLIRRILEGEGRGDCDDCTLLVITLGLAIGLRPKLRIVRYKKTWGGYNHIYAVFYEQNYMQPRKRLVVDCIMFEHPIGYEIGHKSGKEIAV